MSGCMQCTKELSYNEIGAYKKFVNRGAKTFLCKECLAAELHISAELIDKKIEQLKQQGCTLFV